MLTRRNLLQQAAAAALGRSRLHQLDRAVRGPVFAPGRHGYDHARHLFNRRFDGIRPPAVVRVRDAADVRAVVRWANRYDVAVVARSGGNAYHGASTTRDGVVVDLGGLAHLKLAGDTLTAGPGARLIDVYTALAARGATVPAGSCPMVALGGHALGGGMGLAGRALGLTLDRVRSVEAVTADGRLVRVDARRHEDLFWALRGGGGSFAVVTALRLRVHRVGAGAWFTVDFPAGSAEEALAAWDDLAPGAPAALTSIFALSAGSARAFGQYLGSEAALRRLVAPLARVPGARLNAGGARYLALQRRWAACADAGCHPAARATFDASSVYVTRRLSAAGRRAFVAAAQTGATLLCDAYGGAINDVDPSATAFVHRGARFSVQILSYAPIGTARSRVRRARALIAPHGDGHAYQNYADLNLADPARAYYGANLRRLREIKASVDPDDRFRITQGIGSPR